MTRWVPRGTALFALLIPLLTVLAGPTPPASAAGPLGSNTAREERRLDYQNVLKPALATPTGWVGDVDGCDAGAPSAAAQQATLDAINYVRDLVGVSPVTFDATLSAKAQEAALMMAANQDLSHDPPGTWACYSADGDEAAGKSNLYLGRTGADAVAGYMVDEGEHNTAVGHRRWIIDPRQTTMGSGSVDGDHWSTTSNALYVVDAGSRHATTPPGTPTYLPWPQAGYFPGQLEPKGRWSLSATDGADFTAATVEVDGEAVTPLGVQPFYGPNTLVWEFDPDWAAGQADKTVHVKVSNIQRTGQAPSSHEYDVTLFDAEVNPHQSITFAQPAAKTYGDSSFTVSPTASSGLPVTVSSSTTSVCTAGGTNGRTISLTGAGTCTLTASQDGDALRDPAESVQQSFSVAKKLLTVTAEDKTRSGDDPQPTFTVSYSGFAYGQTLATSGVTGSPSCTTTGTEGQPDGEYPITCTAGSLSSSRYSFSFAPGTLTISSDDIAPTPSATGPSWAAPLVAGPLDWTASDPSGIDAWQTSSRTRTATSGYSAPSLSSWLTTHPLVPTLSVTPGSTTCVSAAVRDNAGNTSSAGAVQCRHRPVDDKSLTASAGWSTTTDSRLYNGSARTTQRLGKTLRLATAGSVKRLGVVATRCSGCGKVAILVGGVKRGTVSLASSTTVRKAVVMLPQLGSAVSGPVVLKVATSGKKVQLDGLVVSD